MVRECFVPTCKNNTKNCRNKLFVRIREDMREKWCREVNAEYFKVYTMYCCEDHFDPQIDLKNYLKCKLMNNEPMFKPTAILRNISLPIPQDDPNVLQPECSELYKLLLNDQSETRPPEKRIKLDTIALQSTSGSSSNQDSINRKPVQNASPVGDSLQASSSGKKVLRHEEPKPNSSTLKCDSPPVDDLDDNTSVAAEGALEDHTSADDTGPVQFSWQNSEQISIDEDGDCVPDDDDAPPTVPTLEMIVENVSKQDVEADINIKPEKHTEYFCDCCSKEIIGYTCVQCDNFDLCCSCESKLLHPHHYMLRVPGHKPFSEVNSILEAIREKIKLLTEEAQKNSEELQLDEIKLEEPQFEEVTVDPFSEITIPVADDHTTQLQAHTSENASDTMHTIDTKASDMQKEPKIDQPKAPMKIAIRKDVFFKAYKKKTAGEKAIVQLKAIEMQAKNIAPIILQKKRSVVVPQCRVGLTRLPKTAQVETHPSTSSQGSASKTTVKQKSLEVKDLDSEARIARGNLEENDQEVEMQISRNQKFISIVKKKQDEATRTQSEEFLDEMWLDDI